VSSTKKNDLFAIIKDLNFGKKDLREDNEDAPKSYDPYMVNMSFSLSSDTIMFSNMMNEKSHLSKHAQYLFYLRAIPKKNRYEKWPQMAKKTDDTKLVMHHYDVNETIANKYLQILNEKDLENIKKKYYEGGKNG